MWESRTRTCTLGAQCSSTLWRCTRIMPRNSFSLYVRVQGIDDFIFNGMLNVSQVYFAVSSILVSTIMDRSLSFHKNLKYSMFIWENSQIFKGPYRFHYCISTTSATCVLAWSRINANIQNVHVQKATSFRLVRSRYERQHRAAFKRGL